MSQSSRQAGLKFLIIRRDNIGDLVCTTPIFRALRERYPTATICALVNNYNVPVLQNNPDIDAVFAYTKAKHRPKGKSLAGIYWDRFRLLTKLRSMRFDFAILATPRFQPRSLGLARLIKPQHIIGFIEKGQRGTRQLPDGIPYLLPYPMHEAEDVFRLLAPLGIKGNPPVAKIFPSEEELIRARQALPQPPPDSPPALRIGIHISARKISQRWPTDNFVELAQRLHRSHHASVVLFWSPGDASNPFHPGDDAKAREIMEKLDDIPVTAYPTNTLHQLIGGLALCDAVICSDGGAMHLAAGLRKPILCFFGKSDSIRWRPWRVPHVLLQPRSLNVADIRVCEALDGFKKLLTLANANDSAN